MKRFKAWLIRILGGNPSSVPVEVERKIFVTYEKVKYGGLGRPFELPDWERLATLQGREEAFFRFIAFQLEDLNNEERQLKLNPEFDRAALAIRVRRDCLLDIQNLCGTAAAMVTKLLAASEEAKPRERGLNNNGR
jgi:hypothetical protein